ncbi:MAG: hypothetical protein K1X89_16450 [Myxococcaceae bacterium]|nr:hypothetical protein [Myxococcaceae bacterium]
MRAALAVALAFAGCASSRQVTPWLRTRVEHTPVLYAESGGPRDHVFTERLVEGRWVTISTCCTAALALPGGRAVFHRDSQLVSSSERGPDTPLECAPEGLRLAPDGQRLVCLAGMGRWSDPAQPLSVGVTWHSLDGQPLESREVPLPAGALPGHFFPHFAGFLEGQPLLSAHVAPVSFSAGEAGFCAAWVLDGAGWRPLQRLTTAAWPRCAEADFWRERVPGALEAGEAPAAP